MTSALAWMVAALASWMAFLYADNLGLKMLALLTPFVLWAAVLRTRIRRLEAELDDSRAELDQARLQIQDLLAHSAALARPMPDADADAEGARADPVAEMAHPPL